MSDSPQKPFIEAVKPRMIFKPGIGMVVPTADDISAAMQYELNEAIKESEAEAKERRSFANVGYSALKRRS